MLPTSIYFLLLAIHYRMLAVAIPKYDAFRFALPEIVNSLPINQSHVLQVEHDSRAVPLPKTNGGCTKSVDMTKRQDSQLGRHSERPHLFERFPVPSNVFPSSSLPVLRTARHGSGGKPHLGWWTRDRKFFRAPISGLQRLSTGSSRRI
jgi:hypothetical protein